MERLTMKVGGVVMPKGFCKDTSCAGDCGECIVDKMLCRLAAYEDTGLTPEEIEELKKEAVKMKSLIAAYELNGCIGKRALQVPTKNIYMMGDWGPQDQKKED